MKYKLFTSALALLASIGAWAADWKMPVPTQVTNQVEVKTADRQDTTFYYLYLKDNASFFCAGNAYGTQASVGTNGLKVFFSEYKATESDVWDGKTVIINNLFKGAWQMLFTDNVTQAYVDRRSQSNYLWETEQQGNAMRIVNSEINPLMSSLGLGVKRYLGLDITNDAQNTALSPCLEEGMEGETYLLEWQLVPADYYEDAFCAEIERYETAVELGKLIEETATQYPGIDLSAQQAVYDNTSSTTEQLRTAIAEAKAGVLIFIAGEASQDAPVNISEKAFSLLQIAYDFNDRSIIGWNKAASTGNHQAANSNAAFDASATGIHYENWNAAAFTGRIYATARNLPAGLYKVQTLDFANTSYNQSGQGTYFYARSGQQADSVRVVTNQIKVGEEQSITLVLPEPADIEYGLSMPTAVDNWVGLDNTCIWYYGPVTDDPDKILLQETIRQAEATYELDDIHANKDVISAYETVLDEVKTATSDYAAQLEKLNSAIVLLKASIDDYTLLKAAIDKATSLAVRLEDTYLDLSGDLMDMVMEWDDVYNYTMDWTHEQILPLSNSIDQAVSAYISENVMPGDEITVLIQNNNFDRDISGWDYTGSKPAWGGLNANTKGTLKDVTLHSGNAEVYHNVFSISQTIKNIPAGVYRISCQAFERKDGGTEAGAFLYATSTAADGMQTQALPDIQDYPTDDLLYDDDVNAADGARYVPNSMSGTNYHFYYDSDQDGAGDYTVFFNVVLQATGDITIGIKTDEANRWVIFDNFRLIYLGQDLSAYADIVADLAKQADDVRADATKAAGMGADASKKLDEAQASAEASATAEEYIANIAAFRETIAYAKTSILLYAELNDILDHIINALDNSTNEEAMAEAEQMINDISEVISEYTYTNKQAQQILAAAEALLVKLALPGDWTEASDGHPVEMTQFIKNADIEEGANVAWTAEMPKGGNGPVLVKGIEGQSMEYWSGSAANGTFNYYQTIGAGLPEGKYQLTAQVANSYSDLLETHPDHDTTEGEIGLYALTVDAEYYELVPTQVELCTGAWQQPVVTFTLKEGQALTIGVKNYDIMTARWTVIDNFRLTYFGTDSQKEDSGTNGIETVQGAPFNDQLSGVNFYDLQGRSIGTSGTALQHSLRKGSLFIVRQADGTVRKILVK